MATATLPPAGCSPRQIDALRRRIPHLGETLDTLLGLCLIPIRPGTKAPAAPWLEYQAHRPDGARMRAWVGRAIRTAEFWFAVVTGAVSGVVVVDTDTAEGEAWAERNLPDTPLKVRTRRGLHRYYRHPGGRVPNRKLAPGVDLRGDGGYVLAPGAPHPDGGRYEALGPWAGVEAPVFPLEVR